MKYVRPTTLFRKLINTNRRTLAEGYDTRLLGLDVCDNYVGFAFSEFSNIISQGLMRLKINEMDLVTQHIPPFVYQQNVIGIVVGKPFVPSELKEDSNEIEVRKFISDLCNTRKFEGLEYTYWCDVFASKHLESSATGWPKHESDSRVKEMAAVMTLQAYLDHFWDVERECKIAKK
ncbi:hypothetical protein EZV62_025002 [Acer yangbiense]|uniref:YqgF/RNase H-like domain-containing protein n=1 Tax=Acer yangbiense TaxID=1000413 RepID=A0A5C7GXB5_9ROSI|nr:hypothetical protein EZV62_025002 [Acer yangbiense]